MNDASDIYLLNLQAAWPTISAFRNAGRLDIADALMRFEMAIAKRATDIEELAYRRMPDIHTRRMSVTTAAVDAASRSVRCVFATETPVRRQRLGWEGGAYDEVLTISEEACDLSRLINGPVLDSHDRTSVASQVANISGAWMERGEAWASIRFPREGVSQRSDNLFAMIGEGICRSVSAGYRVLKTRVVPPSSQDEVERHIVERWQPAEISFVSLPADPNAQVRAWEDQGPDDIEAARELAAMREGRDDLYRTVHRYLEGEAIGR